MSTRKPLRALFAEVLLTAAPIELRQHGDGTSVSVTFATIAELGAWLSAAGLANGPEVYPPYVWTDNDGRQWRKQNAYPTWHGWAVFASATEPAAAVVPLPADTAGRLGAVAREVAS